MRDPEMFDLVLDEDNYDEILQHYGHVISVIKSISYDENDNEIITFALHCHECDKDLINFVKPEQAGRLSNQKEVDIK